MAYHHLKFVTCPRCGKTTIEGVGKCYTCGGPIGGPPPVVELERGSGVYAPQNPAYSSFDPPAQQRKSGGLKKAVLGGVAAVTVALGGAGLLGGEEEPDLVIPAPLPEIVTTAPEAQLPAQEPEPEQIQTAAPVPVPVSPPVEQEPEQDPPEQKPEDTPVEQPAAEPTPIAPSEVPKAAYVGSDDSNKYHYPGCRWVDEINDENLVSFESVDDAKSKGYVPCGTCHPK